VPDWISAIILGVVEGLTEFIPVSSTGHLLLAKTALGLPPGFWDTFIVLIQLGAILGVVALYFRKLWDVVLGLPTSQRARHFIIGGVVLLVIDRRAPAPRETDPMALSLKTSLIVGLFQTLALIPGVSRSGGTIVGAMLMGVEKRAAAEFSFFLAMPTMAGAFVLDFWSSRGDLQGDRIGLLVLGFVVSFVVGYAVVRFMLDFIGRRGFAPFGWWRILVGVAGLALLGAS